ncbi:MBL fold metallo-hydrolase [Pontibacter saemangeumensis]|uniref:MBL fold metallo-hydrolase n=1 Tax=Pontibacter saemangeumensis TaxID=1084525 RepID=A0ABP8LVE3_9BACT
MQQHAICVTCGAQFAATGATPGHCPVCEDERQYVNWDGQAWTTSESLKKEHHNTFQEAEPHLTSIRTEPRFGIGQKCFVLQTSSGNVLWDCISLLDEATADRIQQFGGLRAIVISHPHFYASMVEWSHAFGDIPVYIHAQDRQWVMRPDAVISFWEGETLTLWDGLEVIKTGGHFPGSCVLYWPEGANGKGALLTGDTIHVNMDRRSVSFMHSFPNLIPLRKPQVEGIRDALAGLAFERIYAAFDTHIASGARTAFDKSVKRYLRIYG